MADKMVQIPMRLLTSISLLLERADEPLKNIWSMNEISYLRQIQGEIQAKFDALERRDIYTAYKTAEKGTTKREYFREKYLDAAGIPADWRTKKEETEPVKLSKTSP